MGTSVAVDRMRVGQRPIRSKACLGASSIISALEMLISFLDIVYDMELTQKFKLMRLNKGKRELLDAGIERFKSCVNEWLRAIEELEEYPTRGNVHAFAYKRVRARFGDLHSNVVQEAMNRAIETYRAWLRNPNKGKKPIFNAEIISFKAVDVKIEKNFINVPLLNKQRVWLPMYVPPKLKRFLKLTHGRVQISRFEKDYYVFISFEVNEPKPYEPKGWIGVDIGINHIVVVSDMKGKINKFYDNAIGWKRMVEFKRAGMQRAKDTETKKGAWRVLKRLSHKIRNKMSYINHKIAKEIVEMAKNRRYGIALENLKGLRRRKVGKRLRKKLHKWAYKDLIQKIEYKVKLNGVPVKFIDPRSTSKTCSKCGYVRSRVVGRKFKCPKCGFQLDRDLNAARNIAKRAFLLALKGEASSPQGR